MYVFSIIPADDRAESSMSNFLDENKILRLFQFDTVLYEMV